MPVIAETVGPRGFGVYAVEWDGAKPSYLPVSVPAEIILVPGFVDIHIHGAFGIDFMDGEETDMLRLCEQLEAQGYDGFLATTVTAPVNDVARAIQALPEHPLILGIHLEGPFISSKHPGAQPSSHIIPLSEAGRWEGILKDGRLKVVTLAPEEPGALSTVSFLSDRGVMVSMGHTDATCEQARDGFLAGARHATHTFNAMRGFHHREPGMAGFAMLEPELYAELIYDRIHVSKDAAALLLKCKGPEKTIAVSDSSRATGLPAGTHLKMWGQDCVVGRDSVRLANGSLAGSTITLLDAFRNLAADFGAEVAIRATSLNARTSLRLGPPRTYLEFNRKFELVGRRIDRG